MCLLSAYLSFQLSNVLIVYSCVILVLFLQTFYNFCTFVVWITFRRKEFEGIKKEIGRCGDN